MLTYPKINSLFKRGKGGKYIEMQWSQPEFEYLQSVGWTMHEKVDGTNVRIGFRHTDDAIIPNVYKEVDEEKSLVTYIGGRTNNAQMHPQLMERLYPIARRIKDNLVENYGGVDPEFPVTYYGEGFGAGIQKVGNMYLPYKDFCLFDVRIGESMWLNQSDVKGLAEQMDIRYPPMLLDDADSWSLSYIIDFVREQQEAEYPETSKIAGHAPMEGYVLRPKVELLGKRGRIISKIKFADKFWD